MIADRHGGHDFLTVEVNGEGAFLDHRDFLCSAVLIHTCDGGGEAGFGKVGGNQEALRFSELGQGGTSGDVGLICGLFWRGKSGPATPSSRGQPAAQALCWPHERDIGN